MQEHVKLRDIVFGMGACTNSNYASQYGLGGTYAPIASYALLKEATDKRETHLKTQEKEQMGNSHKQNIS